MEFILKKELELLNGRNIIQFSFQVNLSENLQDYGNFDIDNITNKVETFSSLSQDLLRNLNSIYPMYTSLSIYFFINIKGLSSITYTHGNVKSIIKKEDISPIGMEKIAEIMEL